MGPGQLAAVVLVEAPVVDFSDGVVAVDFSGDADFSDLSDFPDFSEGLGAASEEGAVLRLSLR